MSFYIEEPVQVIGLAGKARSGKDYLAKQVIVDDFNFTPLALADWFKIEGILFKDIPEPEVFGTERLSEESRQWLQHRGTENGRRVHGKDIWCRALELQMKSMVNTGVQAFVITDVRFPNEIDWIRSLDGFVFKVIGRGGAQSSETQNHDSENALSDFNNYDAIINNRPSRSDEALWDTARYTASKLNVPKPERSKYVQTNHSRIRTASE